MPVVMKITPVGGNGVWLYLKSVDFEYADGRGLVDASDDKSEALIFSNTPAAMEFWRTMSKTHPVRQDGKPNRPLTAYHATFETV